MKYYFIYLGRLSELIHIPLPGDESPKNDILVQSQATITDNVRI